MGGDALFFNNIELRFPLIGNNIRGVFFHDMGNVYSSIGHFSLRFHQNDLKDFDYGVHAVSMRVVDDGRGFDLAATSRIADHWGLATMRERAEDIGGHINIISRPGYGTEIEIVAPVEELEASRP